MTNEEIEELLSHFRELVAKGNFFKVTRRENKVPLKNSAIKKIVSKLMVDDFHKKDLDHNGSGDYIFVFITRNGRRIYIKFKFVQYNGKELVKFISFHYAFM